ncbi:MAG: hypothetical protein DRI48_07805 [Chloroflexi bacterium]|nr:MAG: hypothetical protein DRI48_07805 [Chloroflexota bacterium]
MMNLWIGLCKGAHGLPNDFINHGYCIRAIERTFANSDMNDVKPELIASSSSLGHTMLLEWKEGPNTVHDQLLRYSRVHTEDICDKALVPPSECKAHDVVVIGKLGFQERLELGLRNGGFPFPLLLVGQNNIQLAMNTFQRSQLNEIFQRGLTYEPDTVPMSYVPFDVDSAPDLVGESVIPKVLEYMHQRKSQVLLESLCHDVVPMYSLMGPDYKEQMRKKVKRVMRKASETKFSHYLKWNSEAKALTSTDTWDIVNNPISLSTDKRTQEYQRLRGLQSAFLQDLRSGQERLPF